MYAGVTLSVLVYKLLVDVDNNDVDAGVDRCSTEVVYSPSHLHQLLLLLR